MNLEDKIDRAFNLANTTYNRLNHLVTKNRQLENEIEDLRKRVRKLEGIK